jgi:CzcA family heavy metal efflux pump
MMRWIVVSSMKLRLVIAGAAALLLAFGVRQLPRMPVDALPEFTRPHVEIQTEALGLSAQEVEAMITTPIEADMINGTPWADQIRSVSIPGLSSINLYFARGVDIMQARQVVQERLTQIFVLPHVSKPATMVNPVASASRSLAIGLTSDKMSLVDMSVLARWTIAPRLMGLRGVANVSIWGERQRQLQVLVDPGKLRDAGLSLPQVIETAGNSLWASPLSYLEASTPGTGGWIETPNQRLGIRHILPIQTAADLAKVPIAGAPSKRLGDVVTLVENHQPLIGDALVRDAPSLMLVVEKFPWANSKDVTTRVEGALASLRHGLTDIQIDPTLFRPATFIEQAIGNLSTTLGISLLLVIAALAGFFANWRTALIASAAVVTSALAACLVIYVRGVEINLVVVTGLMIALSAVIDDAIVDVENVSRRLREVRAGGNGRAAATIICKALLETRRPILYATAVMVLVAVPMLLLEGVSGAFLQPLALTYILAVIVSLAVALTLTPALSVMLLRRDGVLNGGSPVTRLLRRAHGAVFGWAARTPRLAFAALCTVAVVGIALLPMLRQESLVPDLRETDLVVRLAGGPGASESAMSRISTLAGRELRALPGVRNVSALVGRAVMSDKHTNVNASELWVSIDPAADYASTVDKVTQVVAGYPGLSPEVLTYHQAKIREELSGTGESLVVRLYGENTDIITAKAKEVQTMLAKINGIAEPAVQYPEQMPTLEIEVDIDKAKQFGLKPGDVRRAATSMVSGLVVGSLFEAQKVFDVVVWGAPEVRNSVESVRNLLIDRPSGGSVRLQDVASVRIAPGVSAIQRDAVARSMDVTATVRGRDLASVAAEINSGIGQITFPLEYRAELLGEYAERLAAQNRMIAFAVAAALGILLLLQAAFGSWRLAILVFLTLPMALAGGVVAALAGSGGLLSLGGIVGFVVVLGIAVRNGITLVGYYRQLEKEGEPFGAGLVQRATEERSAPVLMTAIVTALAFLPLAVAGNVAGLEFAHPMALIVVGGLTTTTLLTLVGLPALYLLHGAARELELGLDETVIRTADEVAIV